MRYTIKDFNKQFPDDDACLDYIFKERYGKHYKCEQCGDDKFYRVKNRKAYACPQGHQVNPTAGTIFHKSATSMKSWFFAMFLMSISKNGVAALELQRQIGVTYKTAWRMAKQIRKLMEQDPSMLSGTVEADETYIGGKGGNNKRGRGAENKTAVVGIVQRKGNVKAQAVENVRAATIKPILQENIEQGSELITDEFRSYNKSTVYGFDHKTIRHAAKEYVRGAIHTNTIEGFWSQLKRSIDGTFHKVSPKHLQAYVNEFAWRYNHRKSEQPLFSLLAQQVGRSV